MAANSINQIPVTKDRYNDPSITIRINEHVFLTKALRLHEIVYTITGIEGQIVNLYAGTLQKVVESYMSLSSDTRLEDMSVKKCIRIPITYRSKKVK